MRTRQQRALHRVRELLLLLVQASVVDRERRLRGDRERGLQRLGVDRPARIERDDRERRDDLGGRRDRQDRGGRSLLEERRQQLVRSPELCARRRVEDERLPRAEHPLDRKRREGLRALEDRARGFVDACVGNVQCARRQELAPLVRHADRGRVDVEQLDRVPRERIERGLEGEALRERPRHLVERAHAAGRLAFRRERALQIDAELLRLLVQERVLDCDGELRGERGQQRLLVLGGAAPELRVDGEQSDHLAAHRERQRERRLDPRFRRRAAQARQGRLACNVLDDDDPAATVRTEQHAEQRFRDERVRADERAARGCVEPAVLVAQVDGDALDTEQLRGFAERDRQRVREGELRRRLRRDREQRARALELDRRVPRARPSTERVRRAERERGEGVERTLVRILFEHELQHADRRIAETHARDRRASDPLLLEELLGVERNAGGGKSSGLRCFGGAVRRGEDQLSSDGAPQQRGLRTGGLGGEARDLRHRPRLVGPRRERLSGEHERVIRLSSAARRNETVEPAHGERELIRCKPARATAPPR